MSWRRFGAACVALGVTSGSAAGTGGWKVHDMARPRPPVVTPPAQALPVPPPSDAVRLFDGSDLSGWTSETGGPAGWKVENGVLTVVPGAGKIVSRRTFGDAQVHVEWAAPVPAAGRGQGRGNSGLFLMGLYEVQVLDSYRNETYADGQAAAIYGQYPPLVNACRPPGEWQSYDIFFRAPRFGADGRLLRLARVTVIHNGVLVQDNVEIKGPTIWLHYQPYRAHAGRLPLALQEHGHPVRFRNIWTRELSETPEVRVAAEPQKKAAGLRRYTGAYEAQISPRPDELRLVQRGGRLYMEWPSRRQSHELVQQSDTEFTLRQTDARLKFRLGPGGKATGFSFSVAGDTAFEARRMR